VREREEAGWRRRFAGLAGPHGAVLDWAVAKKKENGPRGAVGCCCCLLG
jgi:hypothetical protein